MSDLDEEVKVTGTQQSLFGIQLDKSVERIEWRKQQLYKMLEKAWKHSPGEFSPLEQLLAEYLDIFSLEEGERGETDRIKFEINTGDELPRKQAVRRVPFAVRHEIANQLEKMQRNGVVKPSQSSWSSPIVLVKKRDGTIRFCVDYCLLNSITKPDVFPLPRISDLLDQLASILQQ